MPATVFVKPGPHPVVLMPERDMAKLPAEGALVELTPYWRARIRDGDAEVTTPPTAAAAPAAALPAPVSTPAKSSTKA